MHRAKILPSLRRKTAWASHSHVVLEIAGRLAAGVFNTKTKPDWLPGFEWSLVSLPHHAVAIRELRHLSPACKPGPQVSSLTWGLCLSPMAQGKGFGLT